MLRRWLDQRGTASERRQRLCTGCRQRVRYAHDNPGRVGVLCCTRCLCTPGEQQPPRPEDGGPSVLVHIYKQSYSTPDPSAAFRVEAPALALASWVVRQMTQSGTRFVLGAGWVATVLTVTYERDT